MTISSATLIADVPQALKDLSLGARFRIILGAKDVRLTVAEGPVVGGIFATKFVSATDRIEAISIAKRRFLEDDDLQVICDPKEVEASLVVEQVDEVPWHVGRFRRSGGFTIAVPEGDGD